MNNWLIISGIILVIWYLKRNHVDITGKEPDYTTVSYDPEEELRDAKEIFAKYASIVYQAAGRLNIEPAVILAVIHTESTGNPEEITSGSNDLCYGLMQVCGKPAKEIGYNLEPARLLEPAINITAGILLFNRLLAKYDGNYLDAVAAYNLGSVRTGPAGYLNQGYVNSVARKTQIYRKLYYNLDNSYLYQTFIAKGLPLIMAEFV